MFSAPKSKSAGTATPTYHEELLNAQEAYFREGSVGSSCSDDSDDFMGDDNDYEAPLLGSNKKGEKKENVTAPAIAVPLAFLAVTAIVAIIVGAVWWFMCKRSNCGDDCIDVSSFRQMNYQDWKTNSIDNAKPSEFDKLVTFIKIRHESRLKLNNPGHYLDTIILTTEEEITYMQTPLFKIKALSSANTIILPFYISRGLSYHADQVAEALLVYLGETSKLSDEEMGTHLHNWKYRYTEDTQGDISLKMYLQNQNLWGLTASTFGVYLGMSYSESATDGDSVILQTLNDDSVAIRERPVSFNCFQKSKVVALLYLSERLTELRFNALAHEIAHIIQFTLFKKNEWEDIERIRAELSSEEKKKVKQWDASIKDANLDYALTNYKELFAVTAETLLGQPNFGGRGKSRFFQTHYASRGALLKVYKSPKNSLDPGELALQKVVGVVLKTLGVKSGEEDTLFNVQQEILSDVMIS